MPIPTGAIKEVVLPGGIAIYDISDILPKPKLPRFNTRPVGTKINRVFFHNSGAYGKDGYDGVLGSVRYVINERNFGARPYHFWLARKPDIDSDGNIVIYRMAKDAERCWHTGGEANEKGIGVVWQGNLHPGKTGEPTRAQYNMAETLTNWLIGRHALTLPDGLSFHAEADRWGGHKKPSCPGPYVQEWIKNRRLELPLPGTAITPEPKPTIKKPDSRPKLVPKPNNKNWFTNIKDKWFNNLFPGRNK